MNVEGPQSIHALAMTEAITTILIRKTATTAPEASFETFVEDEHARLYRALCLILHSPHAAEDVMQDAFIRVWERWDRVGGMENPVGYLYRTALNLVRMRSRRALVAARLVAGAPDSTDAIQAVDERDRVDKALSKLPTRQRAAVVLTDLYGFTSKEAGRILRVRSVTVRRLAGTARERLRRELEETDD
jgi:RNA polymerase sigma-70 factor (ECF subfamily)